MTGLLRVYLGAAPGVGKTYKMLEEGRRRLGRGTDVVVGYVETHGRRPTGDLVPGLEVVPRRVLVHRGAQLEEMDVDAVLARRPEVVLVDELAHTNVPGSRHEKRWQDVQDLLDAGITVITTVNVQHLESLGDVVREIIGVPQTETVPDQVVRRADQIEVVDMAPEALRRRLAHGNVYPPDMIDAALGNYFRLGNLTALRELALLWVAGKVDEQLDRYRAEHGIASTWDTRERVVVALTGGPEGDTLIRRAARIAARGRGAELMAVHVARNDGLAGGDAAHLARQRALVESLGGTYHLVVGNDVPHALLEFARGVNATQLVLGASRRGRLARMLAPGVGVTTTAESGSIDVHLVTHEKVSRRRRPRRSERGVSVRRRAAGFVLALVGLPLLTLLLLSVQGPVSLPTDILAFLLAVVTVAIVGGLAPALVAAVVGFLLLNYCFTPPLHEFTVAARENLFALVAFLVVAGAVSTVVDRAARRTREASRARAEAATLFTLAGSVLRGRRPLPALLDQLRETFGFDDVTLLERRGDRGRPIGTRARLAGGRQRRRPGGDIALRRRHPGRRGRRDGPRASRAHPGRRRSPGRGGVRGAGRHGAAPGAAGRAGGDRRDAGRGRPAPHGAAQRRQPRPARAARLRDGRREQSAQPRRRLHEEDRRELLATAEESLDRLRALVENLLDMSRLQAGALALALQPIGVAEVVPAAVDTLGPPPGTSSSASRTTSPTWSPIRRCSSAPWPTSSPTPCASARPGGRRSSPRARSAATSSCASSTPGPASPARTGKGSSCPSSGSATATTPPGSVSAWPCRGASWRRCPARSSPRRHPEGD